MEDDYLDAECQRTCEWLAVASYSLMDQGLYDACADLFAEDAMWVRGGKEVRGRAAIRTALDRRPADSISRHLVTNVLVSRVDASHASATAVFVPLRGKRDADGVGALVAPTAVTDLAFDFVKTGQGWRIARLVPTPALKA